MARRSTRRPSSTISIEISFARNACVYLANFSALASVATRGQYTVVLNLKSPFSAIIAAFPGEAPDWIASPTALTKEGVATFAQHPVGAGPFELVRDIPNTDLLLKRFPGYWQRGRPYLASLEFKGVGSDENAYEALLAGDAQAVSGILTPTLLATGQVE